MAAVVAVEFCTTTLGQPPGAAKRNGRQGHPLEVLAECKSAELKDGLVAANFLCVVKMHGSGSGAKKPVATGEPGGKYGSGSFVPVAVHHSCHSPSHGHAQTLPALGLGGRVWDEG